MNDPAVQNQEMYLEGFIVGFKGLEYTRGSDAFVAGYCDGVIAAQRFIPQGPTEHQYRPGDRVTKGGKEGTVLKTTRYSVTVMFDGDSFPRTMSVPMEGLRRQDGTTRHSS